MSRVLWKKNKQTIFVLLFRVQIKLTFAVNAFVVHSSVIMTAKFFDKIDENPCFESTCSTSGAVRLRGPYGENRTTRQPIRTSDSVGNWLRTDYSTSGLVDHQQHAISVDGIVTELVSKHPMFAFNP